jgi:recombination protein RecT
MATARKQSTAIAERNQTPMTQALEKVASAEFAKRLENALPEGVSVKRFQSIAATAIRANPEVIVHPDSLYTSLVRCAQDGLFPDGREAALVVFNTKAGKRVQYMPMITGLRKRLAEHGFDLTAYVVYENDTFDYALGADPWVEHKPPKLGADRGKPIGAYAVAKNFATKTKYIDVMDVPSIEKVRKVSRAANNGPWVDWWDEQARKTVARRLVKTLPLADVDAVAQLIGAIDDEYELPSANGKPMSEGEANATAAASTSEVPIGDRHQLREEPRAAGPSDAQLNRIAQLQSEIEERQWRAMLRGVFGVADATELTPEDADRYEETLRSYLAPETVEPGADAYSEPEPAVDADGNPIPF